MLDRDGAVLRLGAALGRAAGALRGEVGADRDGELLVRPVPPVPPVARDGVVDLLDVLREGEAGLAGVLVLRVDARVDALVLAATLPP